ncbi:hypothetical protein SDRG_13881 [Saprolegnia diclina VS20]|uniref:HAUS augmin-like complex subunit 6 N-terminal domain-containing protein n=1 Tax=Saprolegnia diclina (strain VS20) TaxID=1156394 RepID=T0R8D4_SAPDV|nr:hypothetical protein SDRG_13881 [Saprolegnia diclina VS20]EQC28333.1 hypothetical protein SDRG_13881 [Saprolegnia diclina VS20]|eukprot:XP_008618203.1 hypothetical protein SDRG_13881 [Saprolegnia diclina VS20]
MTLRKADLLRRNLQLLGYDGGLQLTAPTETDVLCALHFLCLQCDASFEATARTLFPLTPSTKTTLKKLLQQQLEPLVLTKRLPIGSSNMSRLAAIATQPTRAVDLLWRLSTIAMQSLAGAPSLHSPTLQSAQLLQTLQAKVAMKTRQIEAATHRRRRLQAAWQRKANEITRDMAAIQDQERHRLAEYAAWKDHVPPGVLTETGHRDRQETFEKLLQQWRDVDSALAQCPVHDFAGVLQTVEAHARAPPVLQSKHAGGILGALEATTRAIQALHNTLQGRSGAASLSPRATSTLASAVEQSHLHVLAGSALCDNIARLTAELARDPTQESDEAGPLCPPTPMLQYDLTSSARPTTPPSTTSSDARLRQVTSSIERLSWHARSDPQRVADDDDDVDVPTQRALQF